MSDRSVVLATLRQLARDFALLKEGAEALPSVEIAALTVDAIATPAEAPGPGWVRGSSILAFSAEGDELEGPLYGEWVTGADSSVLLRSGVPSPGLVTAWSYRERPLSDGDTLGLGEIPVLVEPLTLIRAEPFIVARNRIAQDKEAAVFEALDYRIYWSAPHADHSRLRRFAYRFCGARRAAGIVIAPPGAAT